MIEVRKLAAVDMVWLGTRAVVAEYALGVVLPALLGLVSLRAATEQPDLYNWQLISGIWLLAIAANYVPLFLYAVSMARAGTAQALGLPELRRAKQYGTQQVIILIPFFMLALSVVQECCRKTRSENAT
jgi:hypothetical protein